MFKKINIITQQSGVTLVEMMIAVSILGILASVAAPNMVNLLRDARLSSQSDLLIATLNNARSEAIKQKINIQFCPAANANTATACSTNGADWSRGWILMGNNTVLQRVIVQNNIGINSVTINPVTNAVTNPVLVTFNSANGSAFPAVTFSACITGRRQHNIIVALSGHIGKRISSTTCP
jgi:type IV fimbrial biogenesis protein FimT